MMWEMVKLGNLSTIVRGSSPRPQGDPKYYGGMVPRLMIEDLTRDGKYVIPQVDSLTEEGAKLSRPMKKGELVITVSGRTGVPAILNVDACIHDGFVGFRELSNRVDIDYLYHYLSSLTAITSQQAVGAIFKNLTTEQLKTLEIPLPPLSIQQKIADILDKADALRRKDQALLKKYDDLAQAIFIDMFGDPVKNEMGWEVKTFETLFETRLGKMLDAKKQNGNKKYKYLGNSNVQWFQFNLNNLAEMEFDEKDVKTFELRKDDILICEGGEVGRAAIWKDEMQNVFFQKAIHRARIKTNNITPEFTVMLFWFLAQYGGLKDYVTTSTISHLTGEKLKTIPIPLPPYEQILSFSQRIRALNASKAIFEKTKNQSEGLFQSLLQQAFKGELV